MSLATLDTPAQLPARMLNEYAYCLRLFYLEFVQQEWAHSSDTLDGRFVHRRVDQEKGSMDRRRTDLIDELIASER